MPESTLRRVVPKTPLENRVSSPNFRESATEGDQCPWGCFFRVWNVAVQLRERDSYERSGCVTCRMCSNLRSGSGAFERGGLNFALEGGWGGGQNGEEGGC